MSDPKRERLDAISTRWTLLRQVREASTVTAADARNTLVLRYLPAVRRYLGAIVRNDQDADDLTQDVLTRLVSGEFSGADPARGRFRDFLKTAIANTVRNHWRRQRRRRSVDYDVAGLEGGDDPAEDAVWTAEWRTSVLDLVWKAMQQYERCEPRSDACTVLRLRAEHPDETSEQLAQRFAEKTGAPIRADALRQKIRRARLQFADLLIAELAGTMNSPSPEKIEEDLVALGLMDLVRDLLPEDWRDRIGP
jgi:RNA polymerase sigma-70 factor (ECF subfamily)